MIAFAANSVLCRLALQTTAIDAGTFTSIRLVAGAVTLWLVVGYRQRAWGHIAGRWSMAIALFVYAAAFSFAYIQLATGTGALLLFGAVQLTMIGYGLLRGERLSGAQSLGVLLAFGGVIYLVSPGLQAPPLGPALLMIGSGVGWGAYSLLGRGVKKPDVATAGNFIRTMPLVAVLLAASLLWGEAGLQWDQLGIGYAVLSGAVTSGLGYILWYVVLPYLRASSAATVQLSVPVLAALGGVAFVAEPLTMRLVVASIIILGGILLVVRNRR